MELDNAGRVKSGKVRKQCELCGEWSNIKWFFKHMSEVHQALFCRCCREYLPIHEQEEHRRWHAEPPYMGQKIRHVMCCKYVEEIFHPSLWFIDL